MPSTALTNPPHPCVHGIFDQAIWTVTYVVHVGPGTECAVIDSVLDFDAKAGRTGHTSLSGPIPPRPARWEAYLKIPLNAL